MFRRHALLRPARPVLALAACAPAQGRPLVDVDVVDRDTRRMARPDPPSRPTTGSPATPGHRYAVRLTNTTGERVLVVLSVDGVNAVTGETAHPSQAGYVLAPWQSTEINGWRKSLEDVAQFVFTDLPDSYAARTGRPDNVGVIGVAVFAEARPTLLPRSCYPQSAPIYAPRSQRIAAEERAAAQAPAAAAAPMRSRAKKRSSAWAPATASANGRRRRAPVSSAPRGHRPRSRSCAMTIIARWSRAACCRASRAIAGVTMTACVSRTVSSPIRRAGDALVGS